MPQDDLDSPKTTSHISEIIKIVPNVLWFSLAIIIVIISYKPLIKQLSSDGISKMSFATFQIEFAKSEFEKADQASRPRDKSSGTTVKSFDKDRINRLYDILPGTKALWVADENPTEDFATRRAFYSIGISFDLARSNNEAQELFDLADKWKSPYDFIISDINRSKDVDPTESKCFPSFTGSPSEAGCKLLQIVIGRYPDSTPPLIFYSSDASMGTPPGAFGATDRFEDLARLVLDAVEHRKTGHAQQTSDKEGKDQ